MNNTRRGQGGFSIIELMITMLIVVIVIQGFTVFMENVSTKNVAYRDKALATQKAVQMLEELRAVVAGETGSNSISVLDDYNDFDAFKYTLTTQESVTTTGPDYLTGKKPISDNPVVAGEYKFVRKVIVDKIPNDITARKVYVKVYYAEDNQGDSVSTTAKPADFYEGPLAEVFSVVQTVGSQTPPTQVMDVFLVVLENVPGWWVRPADLRAMVRSSLINLQARNPGLRIRERWIRRISYGRDFEYSPEITTEQQLSNASGAYRNTYVYPGWVQYDGGGTANQHFYLDPYWMKGRASQRGGTGGTGDSNMVEGENYAMADQFNHAVRYPQELEIYNTLAASTNQPPEISLRMLWEGMAGGDPAYKNSIVINLHGEMVPLVSLRNYSDAAKDPEEFYSAGNDTDRAFRAVSHPEQLHYDTSNGEKPTLRVYAYNALPDDAASRPGFDPYNETVDVTVFIPNARKDNIEKIERLVGLGGSSVAGANKAYRWEDMTGNLTFGVAGVFEADEYSPPMSRPNGLRIRMYGVSTTARECVNCLPN